MIAPYLSFKGDCERALKCYQECFGGQLGELFRYGGSPMADQVPADWSDRIMHGSVSIDGLTLMGADVAPGQYEAPKGFSISVHLTSVPDAERIFRVLSEGGAITMPLEQTFWAARFGMCIDRFGIPWSINCDAA